MRSLVTDKDAGAGWPSRFFSPDELRSKGNGVLIFDREFLRLCDEARESWGSPWYVVSGYRDPAHNRAVGGADQSFHLKGRAMDVSWSGWSGYDRKRFVAHACRWFGGVGIYGGFVHLDDGPSRLWIG